MSLNNDQERLTQLIEQLGAEPHATAFDEQGYLVKLNLVGLQLAELPATIGDFRRLKILILGQTIENEEIEATKQWQLHLLGNRLSTLPEVVGQLSNLQELYLDNNLLGTLPEVVGQLTCLQKLSLNSNQLRTLPEVVGQLSNLQELYLDNNQLSTLPEVVGQLTSLQRLDLDNNQLSTLPEVIGQLTNLQTLTLNDNQLSTLPEVVGQLINLQELYLGNNQLSTLPEVVGQLTCLQTLVLHSNRLSTLPEVVGQLSNLQELYLDNNLLGTLPEVVGQLTCLQKLSLNSNQLRTLPEVVGQLSNLQELYLDNNQLSTLPEVVGQLTSLQRLDLDNNQLSTLPEVIGQLTNLHRLLLDNNQLSTLPEVVGQLTRLQRLWLNNNQLTTLSEVVGQLTCLQRLSLNSNQLRTLPEVIGQLTSLQILWLDNNQLSVLPEVVGQLSNLQKLSLNNNQLRTLSELVGQLSNLQELYLDNNLLGTLPEVVGQLTNLQRLSLKNNQLDKLPEVVGQLSNLQELYLNNNLLGTLPEVVGQLTRLRRLDLDNNLLGTLPEVVGQLTNLQRLDLDNNQLNTLPEVVGQLTRLQILSLDSNRLSTLPEVVGQLTNLQELYLNNNHLRTLPEVVGQLTSLQTFALNNNQLTALPEVIGQLTSLQRLALNNNQLTALPEVIGQFTSLQRLLLSNNQLNTLPLSLGQLIDLRQLSLQNNPWRTMPPEVVEKGFKQVITYLRDLAEGAVNRYNAKVLLVGEGQAGKSSLLRALEGKPFIEGLETTHLIVRHPYPCLHPQNATITMSLNVWDFGGQHIYQATHQFFMTGRSLYLVIWNARVGVEQGKLDHWLRNIQVRAPDAPVLLVATHIDQQPADFNFGRYKEAFPQIVDWIGVSNKHSTNIDMLRQKIAELASQLPLMEQQWPERWVTVEQALLADTRYHIDHQEFVDICIEHGITHPEQQETLGSYLHDLGVILYYRKDNYLNDFIVLKPNWLTRAIAHVLDDPIIRDERYGVIQPADLARLWDSPEMPAKYERRLHPLFLHMMKHFLICYPIEARPSGIVDSLIPLHLPFSPPSGLAPWDSLLADQAEVRIRFELKQFTPPGLMSWFIVLAHPYWHKQDYWREGVRLHYEGHLAEVTANPSLNEIWIRVRGAAPSNFFNILHHILRDRIIRAEYQGLTYESKIPCTCSQCTGQTDLNSHFFDYDLLVAQKQRGKRLEVPCPLSDEDVSILELLEGIHYSTHDRIEARLDGMYDLLKDNNGLLEDNKALLVQNLQFSEQLTRESTRMWNLLTQTLSSEAPSTFLLMPGERSGYDPRNLFDQDFTLYLLCQHPAGPHMVPGEKGYSTPRSRDWWAKVTPWLAEIVKYLKYLPKASGVLQAYDEQFYKNIAFNVELFKTVLEVTPDFQDSKARGEVRDITSTSKQFEAQGSALRALHAFLHEVDPVKRWCGLQKVATNDGNILWLCPEHAELHSL